MNQFLKKHRDLLLEITANLFSLGTILLTLDYFTSLIVSTWINISVLIVFTFMCGFCFFFIYIQKDEEYFKTKTEPYFRTLFLAGILLITFSSLSLYLTKDNLLLKSVMFFVSFIRPYLALFTIGSGFFTFYFNLNMQEGVDEDTYLEYVGEKNREAFFTVKFPRFSQVWGMQFIGRTLYKWGYWYSWTLLSIIFVGFILRIWNVGGPGLWVDESISVLVANGWMQHGAFLLPSGVLYSRDPLSTYFIAKSILLFGNSEFAARLPSVFLGTFTIPLTYLLGKKIAGKDIGLIAAFLITFSFFEIAWSRQARMYQIYQFFFLFVTSSYIYCKMDTKLRYLILFAIGIILVSLSHSTWKILIPILLLDTMLTYVTKKPVVNVLRYSATAIFVLYIVLILLFDYQLFPSWVYSVIIKNDMQIVLWTSPFSFFMERYTFLLWFSVLGSFVLLLKNWKNGLVIVISFWLSLFAISYFGKTLGIGSWWPRYLYFTIPFFFLLSAVGIHTVASSVAEALLRTKCNLTKNCLFMRETPPTKHDVRILIEVCFLLIILLTTSVPDIGLKLNKLSYVDEPQPNYKDAINHIESNIQEHDIIITNRPTIVYYYLGRVDYRGNKFFAVDMNGSLKDWYTNADIIENEQQLRDIVNSNPRGWIIFSSYTSLKGKKWIVDALYLQEVTPSSLDDQIVYVYSWGIDPI